MSGLSEIQIPLFVYSGLLRLHHAGKLSLGKNHIQIYKQPLIIHYVVEMLRHIRGQLRQNSLYLSLFRQFQFSQLIVEFYNCLGFYKQGRTAS